MHRLDPACPARQRQQRAVVNLVLVDEDVRTGIATPASAAGLIGLLVFAWAATGMIRTVTNGIGGPRVGASAWPIACPARSR